MGVRTGLEYRERLRDGRCIYVNGERVKDVTTYPPFTHTVETIAALYDLQHDATNQPLLTYPSPKSGKPVSLSFLRVGGIEDAARRMRAEEFRAEATFGLMGRMPDFMNALVTDAAVAAPFLGKREPRFGENIVRYYEECRERDLCLTHTLVDPQIDRSKGPAEQADPDAALHFVRETERGIIVRGARMLSTLAPFADEIWVGPFYPRKPGEERYALCFAIPIDTQGLKFICREPFDAGRSAFDRPVSSRFDEEDALAVFDDVLVPWDGSSSTRTLRLQILFSCMGPAMRRYKVPFVESLNWRFMTSLACHVAEAIGRASATHV